MASSFTSVQHQKQHPPQLQPQQLASSSLACRELKLIASSFVKQYYTLLNKAPCFIHNFYSHDSTFIHGTIEMGGENHTEPVVGRERIEGKMKELKLNDCRAKIKQIDCLETLARGLVIQVIGELSNNGRPMRRFLQTFVLAPSPDQTRHDGDPHPQAETNDNRREVQVSENSANSSHNQKFYVLNSIFRYQDDGPESEFEDDSANIQASTSIDDANGGMEHVGNNDHIDGSKFGLVAQTQVHSQPTDVTPVATTASKNPPKQLSGVTEAITPEQKRADVAGTKTGASNGIMISDGKSERSEKSTADNCKIAPSENVPQDAQAPTVDPSSQATIAGQASTTVGAVTTTAPRPSNEPKTWANMVRNTLPPTTIQQANLPVTKEQLNPNQSSSNQAHISPQQQPIPHQHQPPSLSQNDQSQQMSNTNRRRHMIRKTANNNNNTKSGNGRTIKNRPPRPMVPTATPTTKPAT